LDPPASSPIKTVKSRIVAPRPKPATLVKKIREPKIVKPMVEVSINRNEQTRPSPSSIRPSVVGRTLQTTDLQKLSRLTCAREFSLFHRDIKFELKTSEHQLAFFQTKLFHLKNEFTNQNSEQLNLEQIRIYFAEAYQKNLDRRIKPDEYHTLADKLKQDIKQVKFLSFELFQKILIYFIKAIDKWLKRKEFGKQLRSLSDYTQKRQSRIQQLIKDTIEETKKQQDSSQENSEMSTTNSQDQSQVEEEIID
jgi:hypothetical protein